MAEPEKKIVSPSGKPSGKPSVGLQGKYTELQLRERGIGKFQTTTDNGWRIKLDTYQDEEVKRAFLAVKRSAKLLCTDYKGYVYNEIAHRLAQVMIDRYLFQRARGEPVPLPGPVISETSLQNPKATKGKLEIKAKKADFSNWDGKIDTISDINWIYNNLMVEDVTAEDAPSPGAWAHLQYHRSTPEAMTDFFTKVYPRLIPAKGTIQKLADKLHDDGRTTFDLLDRLLAECSESSKQVSVLSVVLPERGGLQDTAGQSALSQESP